MHLRACAAAVAVSLVASSGVAQPQERAAYDRETSSAAGATMDCYEQALNRVDDGQSDAQAMAGRLQGLCADEWKHFEDVAGRPLGPADRTALHMLIQRKAETELLTLVLLDRAAKRLPAGGDQSALAAAMTAGAAVDRCYDETLRRADDRRSSAASVAQEVEGLCPREWARLEGALGKVLRPEDRDALTSLIEQKKKTEALMEVLLGRAEAGLAG